MLGLLFYMEDYNYMKQKVFNGAAEFKAYVISDFLPTLQAYNQGSRLGYNFTRDDVCVIQLQNGFIPKVYTVYLSSLDNTADWCEGEIGKRPARDI
jgi:hypothetical protein